MDLKAVEVNIRIESPSPETIKALKKEGFQKAKHIDHLVAVYESDTGNLYNITVTEGREILKNSDKRSLTTTVAHIYIKPVRSYNVNNYENAFDKGIPASDLDDILNFLGLTSAF